MKKIFILVAIIMYCFMGIGFCADGFYVIPVKSNDANLTPVNIRCGVNIFGVTGTYGCEIGDTGPAGGIVFYITPGSGGTHGLEAAPSDQSISEWGCIGTTITEADGTDVGTGAHNTFYIVEDCSATGIAAKVAVAYELNGFNDWFLPSKDELFELYLQRTVVGSFTAGAYWSSSQFSGNKAWAQLFADGTQGSLDKDFQINVRAVRAY